MQHEQTWWRVTTTPKWQFISSGVWTLLAAGQWWRLVDGDADSSMPLTVIVGVASSVLSVAHVRSGVRLRRLQNAGIDGDDNASQ